jgi:predicted RNA-binding Zn-ribbon protein involved in translation (DUF1610 family)
MAAFEKGKSQFTCPHCGATYLCEYQDWPAKEVTLFECKKCGFTHSERSTRELSNFRLIS